MDEKINRYKAKLIGELIELYIKRRELDPDSDEAHEYRLKKFNDYYDNSTVDRIEYLLDITKRHKKKNNNY